MTLDRSARAAVFKASPLPVPKEPDAFEAFRQFILKVKPELISDIRS
jgi:colicin import membrane protein